jgi:hypothetical protein
MHQASVKNTSRWPHHEGQIICGCSRPHIHMLWPAQRSYASSPSAQPEPRWRCDCLKELNHEYLDACSSVAADPHLPLDNLPDVVFQPREGCKRALLTQVHLARAARTSCR